MQLLFGAGHLNFDQALQKLRIGSMVSYDPTSRPTNFTSGLPNSHLVKHTTLFVIQIQSHAGVTSSPMTECPAALDALTWTQKERRKKGKRKGEPEGGRDEKTKVDKKKEEKGKGDKK